MNAQGRIENSIKNSAFGIASQVCTILLGFFVRRVFIRNLSAEYLGVNGLFSNILTMLSLAELGIGSAIVYNMYKPVATNDQVQIAKLMNLYKHSYQIIGIVVAILGIGVIPFMKYIISGSTAIQQLTLIYLMFLANTVLSYFFAYKKSIFSADQRERVITFVNFACTLLKDILQIIALFLFKSFLVYLSIQIVLTFLENIIVSIYADKCYPFLKQYAKERLSAEERRPIIKNVEALFMYKIGGVVLNGTDSIIISAFDGLISVGLLSNYTMITGGVQALISKITGGLTGSIGNFVAKEDSQKHEELLHNITFLHFLLYGQLFVGSMAVLNPFVEIWAGKEYLLEYWVIFVLSLNIYIEGMMTAIWTFRTTMGLFAHGKYLPLVASAVNLVVSIGLAKYLGLLGVLLGTTASKLSTGIWPAPYIVYHYGLQKRPHMYYLKWFWNMFIVFADILFVSIFKQFLILNGLSAVLVYGFFSVVVFMLSIVITYGRSAEFKYTLEIVKRLLGKVISK